MEPMSLLIFFTWGELVIAAWNAHNIVLVTILVGIPFALLVWLLLRSRPHAVAARTNHDWTTQQPLPAQTTPTIPDEWHVINQPGIIEGIELGDIPDRLPGDETEVAFLRRRLDEELRAKWKAQNLVLDGPASARITGRIARIDQHDPETVQRVLWLAVLDEGGGFQAIKVRGLVGDLGGVSEGAEITVACNWVHGRLTVTDVEHLVLADDISEPIPDVKLPDQKSNDLKPQDGKLPTLDELDKEARKGGWGSLNHSVYRFNVPVHITMAPKYRAKLFEGKAAEVQAIVREVAEAEGLFVIACAAESDHLHLVGVPKGQGGMPPTWQWSRWVGRFKALTSKQFKNLTGLEGFQWQTGYAITSINGGKQGADDALELVKRYVESQGVQDDQEGLLDDKEGPEDGK